MEGTFPCSLNHLVDSHFMFLKLVNEANQIFGVIVGSYFATQVKNPASVFPTLIFYVKSPVAEINLFLQFSYFS